MADLERMIVAAAPERGVTEDVVAARLREAVLGDVAAPLRVGRYTLHERLGQGGMGTVWAAWDEKLGRRVALKFHRLDARAGRGQGYAQMLREAQALARLSDPHVVAVYDVIEWSADGGDEQLVVAMELLAGPTLARWLELEPRSVADKLAMFVQAGRGLAAAHRAGIIHRDFKPANVIVGEDGRARVVDFGLARVDVGDLAGITRPQLGDSIVGAGADDDALEAAETIPRMGAADRAGARSLAIAGTPRYMAPEQHVGVDLDPSCDQFAFCVALWEALHGAAPFEAASIEGLLAEKLVGRVGDGSGIPSRTRRVLQRGLAADPRRRHADMDALLGQLERHSLRRRAAVLVAIGAAATFGLLAWPRGAAPDCEASIHTLDEIWSPARATAIEEAFDASGLPYAAASWATARGGLDAWSRAFVAASRDACEAHLAGEQSDDLFDRRMACLADRRQRFGAMIDVVEHAEGDAVARVVSAVSSLPSLERCADVLALRETVPLPEDAQVAATLIELRRLLAIGRATFDAGDYHGALAYADAVLATFDVDALAHDPTRAEAELLRGDALGLLGDSSSARHALQEAARSAQRAGVDEVFTRAAAALVWELAAAGEIYSAHDWAGLGEATLAHRGDDPNASYLLGNAIANLSTTENDAPAALSRLRRELASARAAFGDRDYRVFVLLNNLANNELGAGFVEDALSDYRLAIAIGTEALGGDHPRVLLARANSVSGLVRASEFEQAWPEIDALVEAERRVVGPLHLDYVQTLVSRAMIAGTLERWQQAHRDADEAIGALEQLESTTPASHLGAIAYVARARALTQEHRYDDAIADATHARSLLAGYDPPHYDEVHVVQTLAKIEEARGDLVAAGDRYGEAIDVARRAGADRQRLAAVLQGLADTVRRRGRPLEAQAIELRALAAIASSVGLDHPLAAASWVTLAAASLDLGRPDDALDLLGRADALYRESAPVDHDRVAIEIVRADARWARREHLLARASLLAWRESVVAADERARIDDWLVGHPPG